MAMPSKYKPSYGEEIVKLMADGHSFKAAAAALGLALRTVNDWRKAHPEFDTLVELGFGKRTLRLEKDLLTAKDA